MMSETQHHGMRTTLTLDENVVATLKAEARCTGRPFRDVVNETLRQGLLVRRDSAAPDRFRIEPRDLGNLKPGLSLDNVSDLIGQVEGPLYR